MASNQLKCSSSTMSLLQLSTSHVQTTYVIWICIFFHVHIEKKESLHSIHSQNALNSMFSFVYFILRGWFFLNVEIVFRCLHRAYTFHWRFSGDLFLVISSCFHFCSAVFWFFFFETNIGAWNEFELWCELHNNSIYTVAYSTMYLLQTIWIPSSPSNLIAMW